MKITTLCGKIGKGKRMHIIKTTTRGSFCGMASSALQVHSTKYISLKSKKVCISCRVAVDAAKRATKKALANGG